MMISLKLMPVLRSSTMVTKCPAGVLQQGAPAAAFDRDSYHANRTFIRRHYFQYGYGQRKKDAADEKKSIVQRRKDCRTLELPEDCNEESQVRDAYIKLAKKYHPDGRTKEANAEKFHQIDSAYKNLLKGFADFRHNRHKVEGEYGLYYEAKKNDLDPEKKEDEEESPDIKHTAPQHRQYLSFDGVGSGTPSQREKQYNKYRRAKAAENVMEYRVQQVSRSSGEEVWALAKEARASKKVKTGLGIDRLVEDLIQESMAKGEFDNLSGKGKPLKHASSYNPYIDFTTHKLNQVLIENGFAPEWILLEKDIKEEMRRLRKDISLLRHKYNAVLSPSDEAEWKKTVERFKEDCDNLNKNILKFNLTVPSLYKQLVNFQLEKEAQKALNSFSVEMQQAYDNAASKRDAESSHNASSKVAKSDSDSFIGMLLSAFKL